MGEEREAVGLRKASRCRGGLITRPMIGWSDESDGTGDTFSLGVRPYYTLYAIIGTLHSISSNINQLIYNFDIFCFTSVS